MTLALILLLIALVLVLVRVIRGATLYDRILAVNAFGTLTVLIIALYCLRSGRSDFLDIALLYALLNFVGTLALLRFFARPVAGQSDALPQQIETNSE